MSCRTVCRTPEEEQVLALAVRYPEESSGVLEFWSKMRENQLLIQIQAVFTHPRPEDVVGPEPRGPLLDVLHHRFCVGVHRLLGDGQAHVGVNSIFRWVGEQGDSVPVETRAGTEAA